MQEIWHKFTPISGLAEKYVLELIDDGSNDFVVTLVDAANPLNKAYLNFEGRVFSHKNTNRLFKKEYINQIETQCKPTLDKPWAFFTVENSNYAQWVFENAVEIFEMAYLQHYIIITTNSLMEFIASRPPTVSFEPPTKPSEQE